MVAEMKSGFRFALTSTNGAVHAKPQACKAVTGFTTTLPLYMQQLTLSKPG